MAPGAPDRDEDGAHAVVARVRALLPSLQASDARVAQVIVDEPDAVVYRSVSEVAEAADTSTATVVRCAQKLGFRGFHDLKLALARERATFAAAARSDGVETTDPRLAPLAQVVAAGAQTLRDALALVDPQAFEAVVDGARRRAAGAVRRRRHLGPAGGGRRVPLLRDRPARRRVRRRARPALPRAPARRRGAVRRRSATPAPRARRSTSSRAAQEGGAQTAAITSFARSPLTELAEHTILAGTREVSFQLEAMASRLAHLALLDALLVATAERHPERAEAALGAYSDMLGEHRL